MKWKNLKFSSRSNLSLLLWSVIALMIVLIPRILRNITPREEIKFTVTQEKQIESMVKHNVYHQKRRKKTYHRPPKKFNPNQYALSDWMYLGLSPKQAQVVLKFTRYPLRSNADLEKIFVIPKELFDIIKDSTYYENPTNEFKFEPTTPKIVVEVEKIPLFEIDSSRLENIKGIGPFFAKMVMKYHLALGGIYKKEQLLEVYKMNEATYQILCERLDFSQTKVHKISINKATTEELNKHPYLNWAQSNSIVKMRKQIGGYHTLEEIKDSHLINEEDFEKLLPYLSL